MKHIRKLIMLLALLLVPVSVWGQTHPYAGVWYMTVKKASTHYVVPAADPQITTANHVNEDAYFSSNYSTQAGDPEKPFITTYTTGGDLNSIWIFVPVSDEDNYYYIVHALTGKYVKYQTYLTGNNARRKYVHLESIVTPGETEKFYIATEQTNYVKIRPKNDGSLYFNVSGECQDRYNGGSTNPYYSGLIGGYGTVDDNSLFILTSASSATSLTPVISDVDEMTNTFTITSPAAAFSTIRYTTDGSTTPNAGTGTSTTSGSSITVTGNLAVQAVGVFGTFVTPLGGPKNLVPAPCNMPSITYDNITSKITITCATASSTIHYTTDGSTEPTATIGTEYGGPFSVNSPTTVKAIATHATLASSSIAELSISQVVTPTIQNNGSNAISITCATEGATIYYTTDGANPTTSSTEYTEPLTDNVSNVAIKAIAVKEGMITSAVGSGTVKLKCATPVITRNGLTFTLSCSKPTDATLYYSFDGGSEVAYTGTPVSFSPSQLPATVTAVARHNDYTQSESASMLLLNGTGTPDDPYLIYGTTDFTNFVTNVNNGTTASAYYKLATDVSASGMDAITTPFTGNFDGGMHIISNLGHSLFNKVNGGTVKNVMLDDVTISSGTNVGAICGEATGDSRIYNCGVLATGSTVTTDEDGYTKITSCSSTISGSNYVGGIVGLLDGTSRVINCFNYANVSGGAEVGGIVGHNNVATTATNLKTMVMNCMFYGEVSGTSIAPIYNGTKITNVGENTGVSNFNYFRLEAAYIQNTDITKVYNCALGAETRFLQRFEFFRHLLNSNRALAAWWITGNRADTTQVMKWVLEPTQIGTTTPYPILKTPGKYPSVVNIDAANAEENQPRNKGGKLGTLTVNIQMGNGAVYNHPGTGENEAQITTSQLILNITDKDTAHFNFNYYKVQLPYYNDVGTKNYTGNRVVTGWKIVSITVNGNATTEGTGSYSTGDDVTYENGELTATPYNFADRSSTKKDLYSKSGRVFNQGAYWDVPYGVTAITIEPYWAKCVYLADAYADVVYNQDMTSATNVPNVGGGQKYTNRNSYSIAGESQKVFTSKGDAIATKNNGLFQGATGSGDHTVYDYAVVLVGNYHFYGDLDADMSKPYTVTSIDLDGDNEPDYSYIMRFDSRKKVHPVRVDFINIPGLGMAQKSTGGTGTYNFGIMQPKGWFESTNTSLFRETQFEYDNTDRIAAPYILQGGVMEQWVNGQSAGHANKTTYFHVGGNVWFKEFHRGTHQDQNYDANHTPVSVTGGDFDQFHLTGLYRADVTIRDDNAECYITGGRFGVVAGTGMDGIGHPTNHTNGNITWIIDNADIQEFYAGSFNADKPAQGNLHTIVNGGHIEFFCGGPKFGDMNSGRTVTTTATGCTFGTFFGAGYGGNSYSRQAPRNHSGIINFPHTDTQNPPGSDESWNSWLQKYYKQAYNATYGGISTQFSYQFIPESGNAKNVARIFVEYVKFSLATTRSVTSNLKHCTITGNFYGGGSLGKVEGNVISVLDSCTVQGSVFGAGFSASRPDVTVDAIGFEIEPYYYEDLGTYRVGVKYKENSNYQPTIYTWEHDDAISIDKTNHILYTTEDLSETNLGSVEGNAILTLQGTTRVDGNVYGGGDQSVVKGANEGNTTVILKEKVQVLGNVYGGGNKGAVSGSSRVLIQDQEIQNN